MISARVLVWGLTCPEGASVSRNTHPALPPLHLHPPTPGAVRAAVLDSAVLRCSVGHGALGRCGVAATFFCPCWGTVKATVSPLKFQWGGSRPLVAHPLRDPPGCTRHRVPLCNPFVSPSGRLQALLCERVGGECVCVIDCPVGCWLGMGTPCNCTDPPGFGTLHGDLLSAVGYPPPPFPAPVSPLCVVCAWAGVCVFGGLCLCNHILPNARALGGF